MALFPRADSAPLEARLDTLPLHVQVTLTATQIKTLRAAPITLVPLPGPARWIYLTEIITTFHAGSDPFSSLSNLTLQTGDGSDEVWGSIRTTGLLDQTVDTCSGAFLGGAGLIGPTGGLDNQPITLANLGGSEIAGNTANDATLTLDLYYRLQSR